jgi:predicted Rossmann fold flavoprotein
MQVDIAIVGAGAAGLFAGLRAKEVAPQARVVIFESSSRPLQKVKISGGGRCNVTHACFDIQDLVGHYPRGHRELRGVFHRFGPAQTVEWFEDHGVALKTESDGRIFPVSNSSQTVIDCLLEQAQRRGVEIRLGQGIAEIDSGFVLSTKQGQIQASVLLVATGSNPLAWKWARQLGHEVIEPCPSLFTFCLDEPIWLELAGLSVAQVKLTLSNWSSIGPLLFTHWGLSGPAVLRLSAWAARHLAECKYQQALRVDFLPQWKHSEVLQWIERQLQQSPKKQLDNHPPAPIPRRLWKVLSRDWSGQIWSQLTPRTIHQMAESLKGRSFSVTGKGVFKEEFVTAGGVDLTEIDLRTMQSRKQSGLFWAGEVINVDGVTGGFNFQNAWSTGWLAGQAMAERWRMATV